MIDTKSIHGHEVIFLIHEAAKPFTRAGLTAEVTRLYGPEARFHTCSSFGMTLAELLTFLVERGKVVERDGVLRVNLAEVCSHDEGEHSH